MLLRLVWVSSSSSFIGYRVGEGGWVKGFQEGLQKQSVTVAKVVWQQAGGSKLLGWSQRSLCRRGGRHE